MSISVHVCVFVCMSPCVCVCVPDVVQALLSIVDLEGPVLAAAQLGAGTVGLPLDLQM